jgi:hypothetical protein
MYFAQADQSFTSSCLEAWLGRGDQTSKSRICIDQSERRTGFHGPNNATLVVLDIAQTLNIFTNFTSFIPTVVHCISGKRTPIHPLVDCVPTRSVRKVFGILPFDASPTTASALRDIVEGNEDVAINVLQRALLLVNQNYIVWGLHLHKASISKQFELHYSYEIACWGGLVCSKTRRSKKNYEKSPVCICGTYASAAP